MAKHNGASQFRFKITIQIKTEEQRPNGEIVYTWKDFRKNVPAAYEFLGGTEKVNGKQLAANINARFKIRSTPNITTEMRVVFREKVHGILHVNDGEIRYLELYCTSDA
jgi:SPP1 family predicted phage head-tail adaptor